MQTTDAHLKHISLKQIYVLPLLQMNSKHWLLFYPLQILSQVEKKNSNNNESNKMVTSL